MNKLSSSGVSQCSVKKEMSLTCVTCFALAVFDLKLNKLRVAIFIILVLTLLFVSRLVASHIEAINLHAKRPTVAIEDLLALMFSNN